MPLPWPIFTLPPVGIVKAASQDDPAWATVVPGNVIGDAPPAMPLGVPGGRVLLWSGWMGGADARPADGFFPPDFRSWSAPGRNRFNDFCDAAGPALESRGLTILFRPHARHVLSDPQSCISFLSSRRGEPFGLILDPAGFLTSAMLPRADDHLIRAFEALAAHDHVAALILTNLQSIPGEPDPLSGPELRAHPLAAGLLPAGRLAELTLRFWPRGRPVLLLDPSSDVPHLAPTLF